MRTVIDKIRHKGYLEANSVIRSICGIVNYFSNDDDKEAFVSSYDSSAEYVCEDRGAYGDWQTPKALALAICKEHSNYYGSPDIVIEPTCGMGTFVLAALEIYPDLSELHAIEINERYTSSLKYTILSQAITNRRSKFPDIYIHTQDFFKFDFTQIFSKAKKNNWNVAIVGNPPWVTNSRQGRYNSENIPIKRNMYNLRGIDAITGKSNFDISEYITLSLIGYSEKCRGGVSLLLKNSVIRSIISKQKIHPLHIGEFKQEKIDASKEFNVSVDASCLSAKLACSPALVCEVTDFYNKTELFTYGWVQNSFVSDINGYNNYSRFDGKSTCEWRSGIKHDCASVLELELKDGCLINGLGEIVEVEEGPVYPLMKSSDVNNHRDGEFRKFIIVPQHRVGEDTSQLKRLYPLLYAYLEKHQDAFAQRKSSIYKGKDRFSIFGIGDYSFKPYKIVISSLYKNFQFILVKEYKNKPVMVDDTCYQLGFDSMSEAETIYSALNSHEIQSLLKSLIFSDAKRVVTKGLLMRLDIAGYCKENAVTLFDDGAAFSKQLSLFD